MVQLFTHILQFTHGKGMNPTTQNFEPNYDTSGQRCLAIHIMSSIMLMHGKFMGS